MTIRRVLDVISGRAASRRLRSALSDVANAKNLAELQLRVAQESFTAELTSARQDDARRLARFGAQVYSQCEEDGILSEIFRRIGVSNRVFAECGVGDGLENNTAYRLLLGWSGYWFESNADVIASMGKTFRRPLAEGRLKIASEFLTKESAAGSFQRLGVPDEFDLLSLDIDRNTSHLWRGLAAFSTLR